MDAWAPSRLCTSRASKNRPYGGVQWLRILRTVFLRRPTRPNPQRRAPLKQKKEKVFLVAPAHLTKSSVRTITGDYIK